MRWTFRSVAINQNICQCCFHVRVKEACSKVASIVVVAREKEREGERVRERKHLQEEGKLRDNCCERRKRGAVEQTFPSIGDDLSYRMSRATFPISINRGPHENAYMDSGTRVRIYTHIREVWDDRALTKSCYLCRAFARHRVSLSLFLSSSP